MNEVYVIPIAFNFINWVRDNVFMPLIEFTGKVFIDIFMKFVDRIINFILEKIVSLLYGFYAALLKIIDVLQDIFDALSGTNYVYYTYNSGSGTQTKSGYLTEVLVQMPMVKSVFYKVWAISLVLCVIFIIAAVLRSISNLKGDGQSINDILKSSASTFVLFLVVHLVAFGTLSLSSIVVSSAQKAMNYSLGSESDLRMANCIFAASAINAGKTGDPQKDAANVIKQLLGESGNNPDWSKVEGFYNGTRKYYDIEDVQQDLLLTKIDYISGLICIIFVLKYMAGAALAFVQRIVLVLIGLITAPFFVALTPLDGGVRFSRWKDFFFGACFSSLGIVISINIYFMLVPIFVSEGFIYSSVGTLSYIIRLYSIVVLSLAFEKSGEIVNRIISDANIMGSEAAFNSILSTIGEAKKFKGNSGKLKKSVGK